jgi:DNA repair exonuclease SbcCD nuclease subunit
MSSLHSIDLVENYRSPEGSITMKQLQEKNIIKNNRDAQRSIKGFDANTDLLQILHMIVYLFHVCLHMAKCSFALPEAFGSFRNQKRFRNGLVLTGRYSKNKIQSLQCISKSVFRKSAINIPVFSIQGNHPFLSGQ